VTPAPTTDRRSRRAGTLGTVAAVAAGGAVGAPARYAIGESAHVTAGSFPWPTFWINVGGSFALGVLLVLVVERLRPTRYVRPFLATGVLGAFTTFSTFAVETDVLAKDGHAGMAVVYAIASLAAGLVAVFAGMRLAAGSHEEEVAETALAEGDA
jgi:CrcB protein